MIILNFCLDSFLIQCQALGQVLLAMFFGALIGFDREYYKKPAGLRTHMMVAGTAALIVKLAGTAIREFSGLLETGSLQFDPIRIFVAVVTGISFLGAGTIIREGGNGRVEGLTTAASLLFAAVIGMAVALSQYLLATALTILAVLILWVLGKIERKIRK